MAAEANGGAGEVGGAAAEKRPGLTGVAPSERGPSRGTDVLRISGQAADTAPGESRFDAVADRGVYAELAAMPHWRRILSSDFPCPLRVQDFDFASPRHALAHAQFTYEIERRAAIPAGLETADELRARVVAKESVRDGSWDAAMAVTQTPAEERAELISGLREIAREFALESGSEMSREAPGSVSRFLQCTATPISNEWTEKNRSFEYREDRLAVFRVVPSNVSPRDIARAWVRQAQFAAGTEARRVLLATGNAELWSGTSWARPRRENSLEKLRAEIRREEVNAVRV